MTELTDFAETLSQALKQAGYRHHGKFDNLPKLKEEFADMSPRAMAETFAKQNDLKRISAAFKIIREIYNKPGQFGSLITKCKEVDLPYPLFKFTVEAHESIVITGNAASISYNWVDEKAPDFEKAREFIQLMDKISSVKLTDSDKQHIKKTVETGISKSEYFNSDSYSDKIKAYKLSTYFSACVTRLNKQKEKKITSASFKKPSENKINGSQVPEAEKEKHTEKPKHYSDIENSILMAEIKYLRKINKAQKKLIKNLKNELEKNGVNC